MLQEHMRRILDQCKLQDDYAKDLDERGTSTFAFYIAIGIFNYNFSKTVFRSDSEITRVGIFMPQLYNL